jgi:hypothetical protein
VEKRLRRKKKWMYPKKKSFAVRFIWRKDCSFGLSEAISIVTSKISNSGKNKSVSLLLLFFFFLTRSE